MGALDKLATAMQQGNNVGKYTFIDADTLQDPDDPNKSYRLQGYDAPEISRFNESGDPWKVGTAGAGTATAAITGLAQQRGFNNLVKTGKFDPNGREIVELHNSEGRNFTTELLKSGALDPGKYTTNEDLNAIEVAKLFGNDYAGADEFSSAAADIQGAIDAESGDDLRFRQAAINEAAYAQGYGTSNLSFRKSDRDIRNNARNPLSDAWDQGWVGVQEGAYGFLNLLGEETGMEWAADVGEAGVHRAQANQHEYGRILTDWKDVNGFKSGVSYIANNAAMSLPYMVTTAGAAVAGTLAAPIIGGAGALALGISAPATVYAGQAWNEQEGEKSAEWALSAGLVQASLDRLGIGAIAGKLIPGKVTNQAIEKIMKATGVGREGAEAALANATKEGLAGFLKDTGKIASSQLIAKRTGQNILKGAAGEGITEVMQEAIAYTAAKKGNVDEFDWNELNQRLTAAAIAGSTLGGAFSVPGGLNKGYTEAGQLGDLAKADQSTATQSAVWAEEISKEKGYVPTNQENLANIKTDIANEGIGLSQIERAEAYNAKRKTRTLEEKVADTFTAIPSLWRGATRNIFTDDILQRSKTARIAADLFGGNPNRVFGGAAFEDAKHHMVHEYKNMVPIPEQIYSVFNDGKKFTEADKARISDNVYTTLRKAVTKDGKFNPDLIPEGKHKQTYVQLGNKLNALSNKMYNDQKKRDAELGYIDNYLFKYKALDKKAVHNNKAGFEKLLRDKYKMSAAEAKDIAQRITDDPNVSDIGDAFSVIKGGIVPGAHKKRSLNMSEDADFNEFMQNDMFANIAQAAKSAARFNAHRDFIGKNGEVVSKLLDKMQAEGLDSETVDKIAAQMQDYLDAESGNYKRPTSEFGRRAQRIQKHAMTLMTFSGLPLATISSLVEFALVGRGLKQEQIFGKDGLSLQNQGKDLGKGLVKYISGLGQVVTGKEGYSEDTARQAKLRELGFYDWEVGAATVTGVTEVNAWQQKLFDNFFRANGLTQWTDYTRAIRASFAGDFMSDNARKVFEQRQGGQPLTRDVQEAELKLRNLGLDVDRFIQLQTKVATNQGLTQQEQAFYDSQIRDATFNFVNDSIVLPNAANRPLIYQDPRFALFTQFQGFLSTFTAKVLPKLYRDAFGGGTKSMKYQAWATMATMIMLGFASQHIKDWLKYGFDPGEEDYENKTGSNPYLDKSEYIRRGLLSTGLLGTGERLINYAFPIYEQRSDDPGEWIFNQATGESPALGYVQRVAGATGALAQGDLGRATEQTFKAAPIFGPFSSINKEFGKVAGEWNFDGG